MLSRRKAEARFRRALMALVSRPASIRRLPVEDNPLAKHRTRGVVTMMESLMRRVSDVV